MYDHFNQVSSKFVHELSCKKYTMDIFIIINQINSNSKLPP